MMIKKKKVVKALAQLYVASVFSELLCYKCCKSSQNFFNFWKVSEIN